MRKRHSLWCLFTYADFFAEGRRPRSHPEAVSRFLRPCRLFIRALSGIYKSVLWRKLKPWAKIAKEGVAANNYTTAVMARCHRRQNTSA